jgi:NAD-dependent SIR2 family protein deacetylase
MVEKVLNNLDPERFATSTDAVPTCPNCGGDVFLNVRLDAGFVERPYQPQRERMSQWLTQATGRLLVLEFGAGFNTPGVVRWPLERLVRQRGAAFVRVNPAHSQVPPLPRSLGVALGASAVVDAWSTIGTGRDI